MPFPLDAIRVLDLTRLLPGPFCTMLLADFGAEVIKVEEPSNGDYARWQEPQIDGASALFHSLNRNKKSLAVDLKTEVGKEIFFELMKTADVVVESFRPGVMDRLGLGFNDLKESNPKLVYCAITGYGQSGPYSEKAGHDLNFLADSGLLDLLSAPNGSPVLPGFQIADIGGGAYPALVGILLALMERERSGQGQFIDISMLDGVLSLMQTTIPDYLVTEKLPVRSEMPLTGGKACYEVYETKDGRYLAVAALEEKFWLAFCKGIEREDFIKRHHAPLGEQLKLKAEIQSIIEKRTLADWQNIFSQLEACVSPVLHLDEVLEDPHVQARELIQCFEGVRQVASSIKLSETPGEIRSKAPKLGEHNDDLLREIGLSKEEITYLRKNKVIPRTMK